MALGGDHTTIIAIAKNGESYQSEVIAYLDGSDNSNQGLFHNYMLHFNGVESTDNASLYPAATDILNAYSANEVGDDIEGTFTAYIQIRIAFIYEPIIENPYFNVRFLRPINVAAKTKTISDRMNGPTLIDVKDLVEVVDWNNLPVVASGSEAVKKRKSVFGVARPAYIDVYNDATSMKVQNNGLPFEYYGISELAVRLNEIRTDAFQPRSMREIVYNTVEDIYNNTTPSKNMPYISLKLYNGDGTPVGTEAHAYNLSDQNATGNGTKFGQLSFRNDGATTGLFHLYVPIAVKYNWGSIAFDSRLDPEGNKLDKDYTQTVWAVITVDPNYVNESENVTITSMPVFVENGDYSFTYTINDNYGVDVKVKDVMNWKATDGTLFCREDGKYVDAASGSHAQEPDELGDKTLLTIDGDDDAESVTIVALADNNPESDCSLGTFSNIHNGVIRSNHLYETVGYDGAKNGYGSETEWNDQSFYGAIPMPATHTVPFNRRIDLAPFIQAHFVRGTGGNGDMVLSAGMMKELGLSYRFKLVDYTIGFSSISESAHMSQSDGVLPGSMFTPRSVDADGQTMTYRKASRADVDHQPLVRVDLVDEDGNIIRYGYIKLCIVDSTGIDGDVNSSGTVDAQDVVDVVSFMMGMWSPDFDEMAADMNGDGIVNTADVVLIVSKIINSNN